MSYSDGYKNQCGSCAYFVETDSDVKYSSSHPDFIRGYCSKFGLGYFPEHSCGNYTSRSSSKPFCYITTIVCERLGYDDDCKVLNKLRFLRNNVMQKYSVFSQMLYEYDTIGPEIAKNLQNEDIEVINSLYENYLVPISQFVDGEDYFLAITSYSNMTNMLKDYYQLDSYERVPNDYDYTAGGHGKIKPKIFIKE